MNKTIVKSLYKKEILDVLRDKKTVIMMLVVPLVLYPLLFILGIQFMSAISSDMSTREYKIVLDFEDKDGELTKLFSDVNREEKNSGYKFLLYKTDTPKEALQSELIDAYITKTRVAGKDTYEIVYMSSITNSDYASTYIHEILSKYSYNTTVKILEGKGLDADAILTPIDMKYKDISSSEQTAGSLLGTLIPFMLVMSLLMGTMYPAIDTTAGERERGTLETVLTLPVSNQELIFSKFLTVATIGIVSALLNIISMGAVGVYMFNMSYKSVGKDTSIDMTRFIPAILVGMLCIFAFAVFISAISMCVCAFAKSYKEANNYITPLTLVVMFASFIGFLPNITLTTNVALIPVANICILIRNLLAFKYSIDMIVIVLISNVSYGVLAILLLGKIYNSEDVLFGDSGMNAQIFEKRSNMKKGGVPAIGDVWFLTAVVAVVFIYAGGALQVSYGLFGILLSQIVIIAGIPIIFTLYMKKSVKDTFRLRLCNGGFFAMGAILVLGALMVGMVVTSIVSYFVSSNLEDVNLSEDILTSKGFAFGLLVVALAPSICEELMFRGFIFSALEAKKSPLFAIVTTSVIFGLYHMSIIRFFPTALIGASICYVSYKSKSLLPGAIMHFINNALSVIFSFYPKYMKDHFGILFKDEYAVNDLLLILLFGIILVVIGVLGIEELARRARCEKEENVVK